jgi:hypothetical protein
MPRSAEFLRSPMRLPITLLNFTFTNLGQLIGEHNAIFSSAPPSRFLYPKTQMDLSSDPANMVSTGGVELAGTPSR